MSQGCALLILRSKGQRSRSWRMVIWKWFPDDNWLCNQPMIMKLHTLTHHESRMRPIDFEVKRSRSWRMVISPPPVKPEGTIGLHSVCPSVSLSVCHTRFPDFSWLCFHISWWKLVGSFYMKSYRSSSTFVTVDLLFHELLPFIKNSFSGHFSAMFSHIWIKVGSFHVRS